VTPILILFAGLAWTPAASAARVEVGTVESARPALPTVAAAAPTTLPPLAMMPLAPALSAGAAPSAPAVLAAPAPAAAALPAAAAPAAADFAPAAAADFSPAAAAVAPAATAAGDETSAARVFGRRVAPAAESAPSAAPATAAPNEAARARLAALALGLGQAARPEADGEESVGAFTRLWDFMNDRQPAPTQQRLQARLDAARSFLRASLSDPLIAERVATALRAQRVIAPEMDLPPSTLLARLRRALDGRMVIRIATPSEARALGAGTNAAAVTYRDGRVEVQVHPDATILTRAPPGLLATTLLHELVHAEFGLGEHAAYFVETAYYARLRAIVPALASDPDASSLETLRHDSFGSANLSTAIVDSYGRKLRGNADDAAAILRVRTRSRTRVAAALAEIGGMWADGRWDRIPDKAAWLERRLPRAEDRALYFELVNAEIARLPSGTPYPTVFAKAAAAARAH